MDGYHLKIPLDIRFADFDSLGHVNNAKFLTYLEIARIKYFEELTGGETNWYNEGIILAKAVIDFRQPISDSKNYFIYIRCSRMGTKSLDFSYVITKEENNEVTTIAEGMTVMVSYDYETRQSIPIRPKWREAIEKFEKGEIR